MLELFKSGGFLMYPILLCAVLALAVIIERFLFLRKKHIAPDGLLVKVWQWERGGHLDNKRLRQLQQGSMLGRVLAAGISNRDSSRELMKEGIEDVGRHVAHEMEYRLNMLGTIASITPLLGLLGTVVGMIKVFSVITVHGVGDPSVLAEGISEALLTTAFGLSVAIPSLMCYRYFRGRIDSLIVTMEKQALKLVEVMVGMRDHRTMEDLDE